MKKITTTLILLLPLGVPAPRAGSALAEDQDAAVQQKLQEAQSEAEAAPGSKKTEEWLRKLRSRVTDIEKRKRGPVAVAAVRGAKKESKASDVYWKKGRSEKLPTDKELSVFKGALDALEKGQTDTARLDLETFLASYPKSPLAKDARATLDIIGGGSSTPESPKEETSP